MAPGRHQNVRMGCSGSSVFEVLVSVVVISVLLIGLSSADMQVRNTAGRMPAVSQASAIASSYLAEMALHPWSTGICTATQRSEFNGLACFQGLVESPRWADGAPMAGLEPFLVRIELAPGQSEETIAVTVTVERAGTDIRWVRDWFLAKTP